ncbi:hypothetical protein LCGC14_3003130 [marine sediment metagenome]|uniref:Uncharacterized protein n=1 Tax=marine sediment metagenome TaxID=412755 RepID=A0A0F8X0W4_9ZZZZ
MTTELFIIAYVPLAALLIANAWLFVLNYRWHKFLETKVDSLITKIDQGMAGILELDAD